MKFLKKIVIALALIIGIVLIVGFFLPSKIHVERSLQMNAPAEVVFEQVNTLKNWEKWSPWHRIDPNMKLTYEGPESGNGASYSWQSEHKNVGDGKLTIVKSVPYDSIFVDMDFLENGKATGSYVFTKQDGGILVTWGMDSDMGMNPIGRIFGLFMDKMIGKDFEQGLQNLKQVSESTPAPAANTGDVKIEETTIQSQPVMIVKATCTLQEIPEVLGRSYQKILESNKKNGLKETGSPFAIYYAFSPEKVELAAGMPVDKPGKNDGSVEASEIKGGKVVLAHHYGSYEATEATHQKIDAYLKEKGLTAAGAPWEVYVTDPAVETDQSKWYTQIYYPIQ